MQENEFEKQVQQKMDELKLHPSDAVWQKIEVQIKKEKKRRWMLIFFPIILIGSLYEGYVLLNRNNSTHYFQQQSKNSLVKNNIPQAIKTIPDTIKSVQHLTENKNQVDTYIKSNRHQKISTTAKLKITSRYEITSNLIKDTVAIFKNEIDTTTKFVENEKVNSMDIQFFQQEKITGKEGKPDSAGNQNDKSPDIANPDIIKNEGEKNEIKADTSIKKIKSINKYSWNWGPSFSGGISGVKGIVFGNDQKSIGNYFSSVGTGSLVANPVFAPSLLKSSLAFIAGLTTQKNISRKIIFATGLNYKLLSTTNTVGTDSAAYFRSNSTAGVHHNFFHYIELPVGLTFQIGNSAKTPLYWNIGFSVSQLISSNALQFNTATGLYYHDNSLFNKTQFGFITGFDVALISKQKRSLLIGPYLNYGISKISDQEYNKHHFAFIGLRAQIIFRKK